MEFEKRNFFLTYKVNVDLNFTIIIKASFAPFSSLQKTQSLTVIREKLRKRLFFKLIKCWYIKTFSEYHQHFIIIFYSNILFTKKSYLSSNCKHKRCQFHQHSKFALHFIKSACKTYNQACLKSLWLSFQRFDDIFKYM